MDDPTIVDLYLRRDESAIKETAYKYGRRLRSLANGIVDDPETAEECENDTYLAAWNTIPPQNPRAFSAFLGKIIRNLSFKRLRSKTAQKRGGGEGEISLDELEYCIPDNRSFCDTVEEKELARYIDNFLEGLSVTDRKVFVCRYWYCDSVADICKQFGFGESKVKMILLRTREKLRKYLERSGVFI